MKKNKFKIPKEYESYGLTIKVKYEPKLHEEHGRLGESRNAKRVIALQPRNNVVTQEDVGETFCHELTHNILDQMGEFEFSGNEKRVKDFSKLLHQFFVTAKY